MGLFVLNIELITFASTMSINDVDVYQCCRLLIIMFVRLPLFNTLPLLLNLANKDSESECRSLWSSRSLCQPTLRVLLRKFPRGSGDVWGDRIYSFHSHAKGVLC